jgi:hypothetical protein
MDNLDRSKWQDDFFVVLNESDGESDPRATPHGFCDANQTGWTAREQSHIFQ